MSALYFPNLYHKAKRYGYLKGKNGLEQIFFLSHVNLKSKIVILKNDLLS